MPLAIQGLCYLVASLLFIVSLRGLSAQETARRGNAAGSLGMALAVAATLLVLVLGLGAGGGELETGPTRLGLAALVAALVLGGAVGAVVAARVAMTAMPELVAMLHSFVGLAAVLVGIASFLHEAGPGANDTAHLLEVWLGVLVGAVTLSGSLVAFGKLRGLLPSKPLAIPARHAWNGALLGTGIVLAWPFATHPTSHGIAFLLIMTLASLLLGAHGVAAIGGGDMPVVVSVLNSFSGWAAAAAGFMLSNDLLIVTGALVGSSGAILSTIMCRAMNRSIWNVVLAGYGTEGAARPEGGAAPAGQVLTTNPAEVADLLEAARSVVIIPGFGMAVAQAQHVVEELTRILTGRGTKVRFAVHPVAGRMPGHMNVLLAEANVSYEIVKEMDEINGELPDTDVVLVIGANDVVNPSAEDDPGSPIYGMPVLQAWKAARVVMLKRSMAAGYAGVDNPLCWRPNTLMLFGDARDSIGKVIAAMRERK